MRSEQDVEAVTTLLTLGGFANSIHHLEQEAHARQSSQMHAEEVLPTLDDNRFHTLVAVLTALCWVLEIDPPPMAEGGQGLVDFDAALVAARQLRDRGDLPKAP